MGREDEFPGRESGRPALVALLLIKYISNFELEPQAEKCKAACADFPSISSRQPPKRKEINCHLRHST